MLNNNYTLLNSISFSCKFICGNVIFCALTPLFNWNDYKKKMPYYWHGISYRFNVQTN